MYRLTFLQLTTTVAWDVGVSDVIFETDSMSVSRALMDPANAKITIASLVVGPTQS